MRVLIPRGGTWGDDVARRVADAGLEPLVLPLVRIEPAEDQQQLQSMLRQLADGRFDWVVVTSQSTVRVLPRVPASTSVAAVGGVTAAALRERGVPVAFIPTRQSAAGLVDEWPIRSGRVLWPRALDARPTIAVGLRQHGMQVSEVVAYRTMPVFGSADELEAAVASSAAGDAPGIDAALVTSGSVAKQVARLGLAASARIVAIGEQTAEDCRRSGLEVAAVATQPSAEALVAALVVAARR